MRALLFVLLLAGCAGMPQDQAPAQVSTRTVTVYIPSPVPCFTEAERPKLPPKCEVPAGATTDQVAACAKIDAWASEQFGALVDALFLKCSQTSGAVK